MDLLQKSNENISYMVQKILEKMKFINQDAMNPKHFYNCNYQDLLSLYRLVMKRDHFSPAEMQAIAEELGNLKKK